MVAHAPSCVQRRLVSAASTATAAGRWRRARIFCARLRVGKCGTGTEAESGHETSATVRSALLC